MISINGYEVDALGLHLALALVPLVGQYRSCSLSDDKGAVSFLDSMLSRCLDAKVTRQAHDKDIRDTRLLERLCEPAITDAKRVVECRVHLHPVIHALLNHHVQGRDVQFRHELGAGRVLDAVDGPQRGGVGARRVGRVRYGVRRGVGRGVGVVGGEGDVMLRVPVLGGDLEGEGEGE